MSRFTLTLLLNIVLACCWSTLIVFAAPVSEDAANEPIHIEADRMESDQHKSSVIFAGNVEATQGNLIIRADQMTVYYHKSGPTAGATNNGAQSIENLHATGNVKIIKEDWLASGEQMEFATEGRKVVLTGTPKIWQGDNTVTGDKIILYLDEGKSVVENETSTPGNRVKAFFYPESDQSKTTNQ